MKIRKLLLALSILALSCTPLLAQGKKKSAAEAPPAAPADPAAKLSGLDDLAAKAMTEWKVPGVAIGVVKDGKLIFGKGYGYRDVEQRLPVTPDTLFAIGSITKSFTSLTFSILNDDGKVDWDKPVHEVLPEFVMADPVATDHVTPRDLLSHRTGLPRHDLTWYSSDFSRVDLVNRVRYLKLSKDLRTTFQYNNLMMMTVGYLEGKVTGLGWEGAVRSRIFEPLGMTHSNFAVADMAKSDNRALAYEWRKDAVKLVPYHNIDSIGPAGSINSSINDMSHYLMFQLGDGSWQGKRLVSESNLRMMHSPQTAVADPPAPFAFPELGHAAYGLAWVVTSYRGHNLVWHNGGIDGFYALLSMLPDDHMGVVVLTNLPHGDIPDTLAYNVYDRLLGLDQIDWLGRFKEREAKQKKEEEESKKTKPSDKKPGTHPSHPLEDYAGEYENPGYGTLKITQKGDAFEAALNTSFTFPLQHFHYDIFQVPEDSDSPAAGTRLQFEMSKQGDIDAVGAVFEPALGEDILFHRVVKLKPEDLRPIVGDYALGEMTATVTLADGALRLSVPGQPQYELLPKHGLSFDVKGLPGFSVEFKKDAAGRVTEAVFNQPNGAFTAKRK
jgi:CubicO group peptidase (beta-lactamase class C family)